MSDKSESFSHYSVHVAADTWVSCYRYAAAAQAPILSIQAGASEVSITTRDRKADQSAVEFARRLVREVQAFAAEVERLHAEQAAPDESAERAA
jgi:hypothetical protein